MEWKWKKLTAVILVLDMITGLLLFLLTNRNYHGDIASVEGMDALPISENGAAIERVETREARRIALSFDDGPHPVYTPMLLEGLKRRGVQASFFVVGERAARYPELIRRMSEEGHLIGNHTYSHLQYSEENAALYVQELQDTDRIIRELTGKGTEYVRPPYGCMDKQLERQIDMFTVLWTIDPLDWCTGDAACVTERILAKAEEDGTILLHDCYESSVYAALSVVDILTAQGYEFVTVDRLIMD